MFPVCSQVLRCSRFVLRSRFVLGLFTFCPGVGGRWEGLESQCRVPYPMTTPLVFATLADFAFGEARPSLKKYEKNIP